MSKKPPRIIEYYDGEEDFLTEPQSLFAEEDVGLVLDVETTGLQAGKDRIIEIGLIQFTYERSTGRVNSILQRKDFLQDPGMPLSQTIIELTGLTDDALKGQAIDRPVVEKIIRESSVIIAHNAGFDRSFLHAEFPVSDQCFWACSKDDIPWRENGFTCRVQQHLCNDHGFYYDGHRAEIDCMALLKLISCTNKAGSHTYLKDLLEAAFAKENVLYAWDAPYDAKDTLKNAGFRWDAQKKVWSKKLKETQWIEAEELMKIVYKKAPASHEYKKLSSKKRFLE